MSATIERDAVICAVTTDFKRSLSLARKVSDPWFRCQALAYATRFAPDVEVIGIAEEALAAALESVDPYRRVGASAWPLRALLERQYTQEASKAIPRLLSLSTEIENSVSRVDALFLLWQAFFPFSSDAKKIILDVLVEECRKANSWKAGNILRQTVLILASENFGEAERLAVSMPEGVFKRQALRRLALGQTAQARSFFHFD